MDNPWASAANSYGQDLDQLGRIQQQGMMQAAQAPLQLYDRFMDGYEKARQRAMQEKQAEMQQAQLERQNRMVDLKYQQDAENEAYRRREDQRKSVLGGMKDMTTTSGEMIDDYTPPARGVFKQRFLNAALAQGKSPEEADALAEKMLPGLQTVPVVQSATPEAAPEDGPVAGLYNNPEADSWDFSAGDSQEDTFRGQKVIAADELARKNVAQEEFKLTKEEREAKDKAAAALRDETRLGQTERRLDIMQQGLNKTAAPKPAKIPPASAIKGISENQKYRSMIQRAIELVKQNPKAFGAKNFLGDTVVSRIDPGGVAARAAVAAVGAHVYHDISGAAVTVSEDKRLSPYAPKLDNEAKSILTKLNALDKEYGDAVDRASELYSEENGFVPVKKRDGGKTMTRSDIAATAKKHGKTEAQVQKDMESRGYKLVD